MRKFNVRTRLLVQGPRAGRRRRSCWSTRNRDAAALLSGLETAWVFVASKSKAIACAAGGTRLGRFLVLQHEPEPGTARRAALNERTRMSGSAGSISRIQRGGSNDRDVRQATRHAPVLTALSVAAWADRAVLIQPPQRAEIGAPPSGD